MIFHCLLIPIVTVRTYLKEFLGEPYSNCVKNGKKINDLHTLETTGWTWQISIENVSSKKNVTLISNLSTLTIVRTQNKIGIDYNERFFGEFDFCQSQLCQNVKNSSCSFWDHIFSRSICRYLRLIDNIVNRCNCLPNYLDDFARFRHRFFQTYWKSRIHFYVKYGWKNWSEDQRTKMFEIVLLTTTRRASRRNCVRKTSPPSIWTWAAVFPIANRIKERLKQ